jgi:sporulation protein YlmC with PRC-barrel domain
MLSKAMPLHLRQFLPHKKIEPNEGFSSPLLWYAPHGATKTTEEDMLGKHFALALLGTTLITAPALAQTNPPAGSTTAAPAPSTTAPASGAMSTGTWMTQEQPGQWRASKLDGLNVYNQNNEKIGDISELVVDSRGTIQAVVVGVGGFLGMGERDVAIPFDQIKFVNEPLAVATTATTTDPNAPAAPRAPATATAPATPAAPGTVNPNAPASTGTVPTSTGTVATDRSAAAANRSAPDHAVLTTNMTKDQLKAAPEFKYAR